MLRLIVALSLLGVLTGCSYKILRPVDDTESTWRPVDAPTSSAPPPPAPIAPDVGY